MNNKPKSKLGTIIVIIFTLILAGIAIFTAVRLYQLRNQAVAPNVPSSKPKAQVVPLANTCTLSFTLGATASPTATATATATATGSPTASPTITPGGTPNSCNGSCGSNLNCQSNYVCYQGFCRNPSCTTSASCTCSGATATPATGTGTAVGTPAPSLPNSGTAWPTLVGVGLGILVILGSMILAI